MDEKSASFVPYPVGPRILGSSGIEVPPLAWGMWRFHGSDSAHAGRLVRTALDSGESFGAAEALLGRVLESDPGMRHRFVLASKGGILPGTPYDSSAAYLIAACEASLRRLKCETIDLYQIHRPDLLTSPEEVAAALVKLRESGKIRAAGVSNFSAPQVAALQSWLPFGLAAHQLEFSPLRIEPLTDATLDQSLERRFAIIAWSPLAGGRLAGPGSDARSRDVIAALEAIATRQAVPRTAVALAWVLAHPSRPVAIVGSQNAERIAEATRALEVRLTRAEWYAVLTASRQEKLP